MSELIRPDAELSQTQNTRVGNFGEHTWGTFLSLVISKQRVNTGGGCGVPTPTIGIQKKINPAPLTV
ncbi:hypothetical protein GCM10022238_26170 [Gordonia hankookensis]